MRRGDRGGRCGGGARPRIGLDRGALLVVNEIGPQIESTPFLPSE